MVAAIPFPTPDAGRGVAAVLERSRRGPGSPFVSHVTSPTGLVLPIEPIVRELDARGIDTLVDGAHAPGMVPLALDALGAAYYTGNGHKWLCAPKGAGLPVGPRRPARRDPPGDRSHGANDHADRPRFRLEFDWVGTGDPTAALTLPAAIDWMAALDARRLARGHGREPRAGARGGDRLVAALGGTVARAGRPCSARWRRSRARASPTTRPPRS